jgi:rod shape-determining protein MreC
VDIQKTENELFQAAYVQPVVDFETLRAILVITNFQTTNITPLTNETTR